MGTAHGDVEKKPVVNPCGQVQYTYKRTNEYGLGPFERTVTLLTMPGEVAEYRAAALETMASCTP